MPPRLKLVPSEIYVTKYGEKYEVVTYNNAESVILSYLDHPDVFVTTRAVNIRKGDPYNPYRRVVCNKGYHGIGYPISVDKVKTSAYIKWHGILTRCYGPTERSRKAARCYLENNASVDEKWYNFQNFAEWYYRSMSTTSIGNSVACLDSDLLNTKGNLYSEETCCILPYELNIAIQLATKMQYDRVRNSYCVKVTRTITNQRAYIGRSPTEEGAWVMYCNAKDQYIRDALSALKCSLPLNVVDRLMNFNSLQRVKELGHCKI